MKVGIQANRYDRPNMKIAKALQPVFRNLADRLSGEYGGIIEHLWIDFELSEMTIETFGKPPKPFRFQKRVSGHSRFGLPAIPDSYNVGHYSVCPDFDKLREYSINQCIEYGVRLIYESTEVLIEKQKRLGGFDASKFREHFKFLIKDLGFDLNI